MRKMKIKNGIFENKQYFETIVKIHSSDKLSIIDAYRIKSLVDKLYEIQEKFSETKKKIIERHGESGEEGTVIISAENRAKFNEEYNKLIITEHDLGIEKLEFPRKIEDGFSAKDLNILENFFDLSRLKEISKTE